MTIIWALSAAISYGIADFGAAEMGRREGVLKTLLYVQLFGSLVAVAVVASAGVSVRPVLSLTGVAAALISLELMAGNILLYRALAKGPLFVVAPITSGFVVITVLLSIISGERLRLSQAAGVVVTIAGVILVAAVSSSLGPKPAGSSHGRLPPWSNSGIGSAIGAAVLIGIGIWMLGLVVPSLGSHRTVLVMRLASLVLFVTVFLASKRPPGLHSWCSLKWLLPLAVLDTLAIWFMSQGFLSGLTSVVSVITSLYSVVTIVLGWVILEAKGTRVQQIGVAVTLVGVALVSS